MKNKNLNIKDNIKSKHWIFPCNLGFYDVYGAFEEYNELFWRQNIKNIKAGDKVFIYVGKPESKLSFYCEVIDNDVSYNETRIIDDSKYNLEKKFEEKKNDKYTKIKLLKRFNDNRYDLNTLNKNGLKGNIQSQQEVKGELLDFILKDMNKEKKHSEEKILSVGDNKSYYGHVEILNSVFNMNYKGHQKATKNINNETRIWFPKIEKDKNGKIKNNKSNWKNNYNDDCSIITTIPPEPKKSSLLDYERINLIFIMFNNHNYKFVGAFKLDKEESNELKHVQRRVATKVRLIGSPVSKVELIIENRNLDDEIIVSTNDVLGIENIEPSYTKEEKKILKEEINKKYDRNIIKSKQEILRSNYKCCIDSNHESFITKNGHQYMEAHHIIPLCAYDQFEYSLDVDANIVSLCPNCHRKLHFGANIQNELKRLYELRKEKLMQSGIDVSFDKLLKYYK